MERQAPYHCKPARPASLRAPFADTPSMPTQTSVLPRPAPHRSAWIVAVVLLAPVAVSTGCACALFLWSLDAVTRARFSHPWLLLLLPAAGWATALVYQRLGKGSEAGNRLLVAEIREPSSGASRVPGRMAPLILLGTLATHLCGGSAGREGTALQMGGALAAAVMRRFALPPQASRFVLLGGIAAGFGGVFGTPLAGAFFATELAGFRRNWTALPAFATAALLADATCRICGISHTPYSIESASPGDSPGWGGVFLPVLATAAAGAAFGWGARLYLWFQEECSGFFRRFFSSPGLRSAAGGSLVLALYALVGSPDYLGLGVLPQTEKAVTLPGFFQSPEVHPWSWLGKMLFTVVTLGSGFRGGEVTPLFFIGAAMGNALSMPLHLPPDWSAGMGLVALFGAAAKTPLACWVLSMEVFGLPMAPWMGLACIFAFWTSGKNSLYAPPLSPRGSETDLKPSGDRG